MEYFDILDKNGNKTGIIKERSEATKDKDLYRTVYLWIVNTKGILLQKRTMNKTKNPGKWDCAAAGHIEAGEESIDAIIRETKEELGIDISKNELKLIYSKLGFDDKYQFHDVYLLEKEIDINNITIQKEEVECCKYVELEELKEIIQKGKFSEDFHNEDVIKIIDQKFGGKYDI